MQTQLLMFIKSLEQILNATYYLAVRLSNFISQPGGRGALSLLSLIFPRFSMPRSQKLDSLGFSCGFFSGISPRLPIAGFSGRPQERRSILNTSRLSSASNRKRTTFKTRCSNNNIVPRQADWKNIFQSKGADILLHSVLLW